MPTTGSTSWEFPEYYAFPPFFTLQPVRATREKQLELWKDFILDWHKAHERTTLDLEFEYFTNVDIHRTLNEPGRRAVVEYLIQTGHAEWEDAQTRARCKLYWKKPQLWAAEIYQFASQRGMINNVYTVHELHSGEETTGASFHGVEEWIIVKALDILEQSSKVTLFRGEHSSENGVKFLSAEEF